MKHVRWLALLLVFMLPCALCALAEDFDLGEVVPVQYDATTVEVGAMDVEPGEIEADFTGEDPAEEQVFGVVEAPEAFAMLQEEEPAQEAVQEAEDEASPAPAPIQLGVGEKYTLPEIEGTGIQSFSSEKPKVVSVSAGGVLKGKKKGTARVTAVRGETTVVYTVRVLKAPKTVKFTSKKLTLGYDAALGVGEQGTLPTKLTPGSSSRLTYSGYDRGVISVNEDGTVTAVGVGSTKVTARTFNKKKATIAVRVLPAPGSIALRTDALNMSVGFTYAMTWELSKGTASALEVESDNPACVTADAKGVLTAHAEGTANVAFTSFNGVSATCAVTVLPAPEAIPLTVKSLSMGLKEKSAPLLGDADPGTVCGGVKFTSSNKKAATVNAAGVVTAKKKGIATIKAVAGNGTTASIKVRVRKAPTKLLLNAAFLNLELYTTAQLVASLPDGQGGTITYASSNEAVAQVDASGVVTGVGAGSAVITARTYNGKRATCAVEVIEPSVEIRMADVARVSTATATVFPIEVVRTNGQLYEGPVSVTIEPAEVAVYEDGSIRGLIGGQTGLLTVVVGATSRTCAVIVEDSARARDVKAIAHRGSAHWEENTLEAFRNFASTGADGVELDIRSTSDGVQVVLHDATYYAAGVIHTVSQETFETNKSLVPNLCTLDEALDVIARSGKEIYLNPKETADGAKLVAAVKARGLESRTLYFGSTDSVLQAVYAADPSARLGYSLGSSSEAVGDALLGKAQALHVEYIVPHKAVVTQAVVDYWHNAGYKVCVWTVNDMDMLRALCDMGVEAILTDYPEYCVEARAGG